MKTNENTSEHKSKHFTEENKQKSQKWIVKTDNIVHPHPIATFIFISQIPHTTIQHSQNNRHDNTIFSNSIHPWKFIDLHTHILRAYTKLLTPSIAQNQQYTPKSQPHLLDQVNDTKKY